MEFERLNFAQGVISAMGAMGLLKISIAFFLLRLNKTDKNWYTKSLWALIGTPMLRQNKFMQLANSSKHLSASTLSEHGCHSS